MARKNSERDIAPSDFQPNLRVIPGTNGGGDTPEYITPERSGLESGFYVESRGLPWHVTLARRLDTPELMQGSDRTLTVDEALSLGGLDWEVGTAPVTAEVPGVRNGVPLAGRKVTYRKDTGAILSGATVSDAYKVVQNRDAFAFADNILDTPGAHCESAGSLFGGRWVFLSMELPDDIQVANDPSDYRLFLLISNGHDGNHKLRVDVTVERVICRNTLRIAQGKALSSWSIRHTSGIEGRVQQAREALALTHKYAETFTEDANRLVTMTLAERQVASILDTLFPLTEKQQERVDKDREVLASLPRGVAERVWRESPTVEPVRGTAYGVLAAVTEYADHFRDYREAQGGSAEENRAEHLMLDSGDVKDRAWALLTSKKK